MTVSSPEMNDPMLAFILGLLSHLLPATEIENALIAVRQTIAAYQPAGPDQLMTIAQIVGFALTSLDSLRLSMPADLSTSMKLKLRGNANALTQSSQRATATLDVQRRETNKPAPDEAPHQAAASAPGPNMQPPPKAPDRERNLSWANAMTAVAAEFSAELANLPPDQRQIHLRRIGALTETASALKRGNVSRR